jgi:NitT/TauT family transport system substrate-binding protein
MSLFTRAFILLVIAGLTLTGCQPAIVSGPAETTPAADSKLPAASPTPLVLGLGYIPSVQFAPFYVARDKGFFADEGLDVQFQHGFETDFLKLVGTNELQFAVASGEQVILARAQGLPVTYAATWYRKFPVVVFAPAEGGITQPKDLEGKKVGLPGLFGASLVGWKALVNAAGIDETKVTLESIGFTQAAAVSEGRVDAALDYIVNGPVQLRLAGREVVVLPISDYAKLPANGLVTNDQTIQGQPELVERMTRAMLRGLRYTLDNPDEAFAISIDAVPEAGGDNEAVNRAIFDASLDLWQAPEGGLGRSDAMAWQEASQFMADMGLVSQAVPVDELFTNQFAEAAQVQ